MDRGLAATLTSSVLSVWLLGCPGAPDPVSDAGTDDAGVEFSPVELCDRLAKARCDLLAACYPAYQRQPVAQCRADQQASCLSEYDSYRVSFEEKKVEVDTAALARCETRMAARTCPPTFPPGYAFSAGPFSECGLTRTLLKGKVATGAGCRNGLECAPGVVCLKPGGVCLGTCSQAPVEGEPCAFGCSDGLYCDLKGTQDTSDDRCAKAKVAGERCETTDECNEDHYCVTGTCRARGRLNEGCVFDPLRISTCEAGLACDVVPYVDGAQGTCIKPRGVTEKCRFHWSCEPGYVCGGIDWAGFPAATPGEGICIPPQPTDSACSYTAYSTYVGETCRAGSSCNASGVCKNLGERGDVCTPSAPNSCAGLGVYCQPASGGMSGTCLGPPALNQRCGIAIDNDRTVRIPCSAGYCEPSTLTCRTGNKPNGELCQSGAECSSNRCAVQLDRTQRCAVACN